MSSPKTYKLLINGEWKAPSGCTWIDSINPFSGEVWARVPKGGASDVEAAVAAAKSAFENGPWRDMTATQRGALLRRLGDLIGRESSKLAETEIRDNGKLAAEVKAQVSYLPEWFYYFAGLADKVEGAVVPIDKPGIFAYTRLEPVGVVAAITPWNSPLMLAAMKMAPALAGGNTIVLKPSEYTSASSLELAALFEEAGFPPGVVNVVTGCGAEVGQPLVGHPDVGKVAFTGGELGGAAVYQNAAGGLKDVLLELGGKSPNIVFDDANLDNAVNGAIAGIFAASGQTCIAGSRLLVQSSVYETFVDKLLASAKTARLGDPLDPQTQVGPVTTPPQYKKILDYIAVAKDEGARCVMGGGPSSAPGLEKGLFVEPTIFLDVTNDMRIAREEVFGPVLSIIRFDDEAEAVRIANDTSYGLAAGVWTENLNRALRVEQSLRAGTVWINTYRALSATMPFGGFKRSGVGRENGIDAIREYLETKSVWINTTGQMANPFAMQI